MWFLRQGTASQEIPLGPFLDSSDGNTPETALSIANTDVKLQKTGGTSESSKNSGGATHLAGGRYYTVLDATDTDTIGPMRVSCHVAGALAVWLDCCVLSAQVYDVMFGAVAPSTYAGADTAGTTTLLSRVTGAVLLASGYTAPDNAGISAVKAKTDNLPSDPADQSLIIAATDAIMGRLGTPAGVSVSADIAAVGTAVGDVPNNSEFASAVALLATSAQLVKVLAAVYDSVSRSGDVLTLSNAATQTINASGRTTVG